MGRNPDQLRTSRDGKPFTEEQLRGLISGEDLFYIDVVPCTFEPSPLFSRVDHFAIVDFLASSLDMLCDSLTFWFSGSSSEGSGHSDDLLLSPVDSLLPDLNIPTSYVYQEYNPLKKQGLSRFSSTSHSTLSRRRVSPSNGVEVAY